MPNDSVPAWLARTSAFLSADEMDSLRTAHVLVVGLGGVGGIAAELIARSGVAEMTIVDGDTIEESNINRQIPALHSTVDTPKAMTMADRIRDINPDIVLHPIAQYLEPDDIEPLFEGNAFTAVLDAIDSVRPKIALLAAAAARELPTVSSMGAGLRYDPGAITVADISDTHTCPLAKNVRKGLRDCGVESGIRAVFSTEIPGKPYTDAQGRPQIGTISYMPAAFGVRCAAELIRLLLHR